MKQETKKFTSDVPMVVLSALCVLLAIINSIIVFARLRSNDFKVPVQYVVYDGSVLQSANWYSLYSLVLFVALGTGVSIFLAHRLHKGNRLFAGGVLVTHLVIAVISFLVINSLLHLVGKV